MNDMRRKRVCVVGALLVAAAAVDAQSVLDVTLRVVDDVSNLDAVVLTVGAATALESGEEGERAPAPQQSDDAAREAAPPTRD